jgi:ElaB/YqjD/DUF883 family membrane-anchored ribosome-binding protein
MMMSALKAGGMDLVVDDVREADVNNPNGYYEFERVKKMPKGDIAWLKDTHGKAIKVISALLTYLPKDHHYKVIFMERDLDEILASQQRMLERSGKTQKNEAEEEKIRESYQSHLHDVKTWLGLQDWLQTLTVSYNDILSYPDETMQAVAQFLDNSVDAEAMTSVVDPGLYREKSK